MSQILFACFLLLYILTEVRQTLAKDNSVATTFTGLRGDYNFGHIGYIYLESDTTIPELEFSSCPYQDINQTTCSFDDTSPKSDGDIMVLRAWTALTLRDNILTLFGYLMHHMNSTFDQVNYSNLRILYEEVRRNNIKTMDLLTRMKTFTKMIKVNQILSLFGMLRTAVPPFCHNAIEMLNKLFLKKRDYLYKIFGIHRGFDLFADIDLNLLPLLRVQSKKRKYNRAISIAMGKEFAVFFSAIVKGNVILTQPVLAALMLNMKFTELPVDANENFRFLVDALILNKIPEWSPGISCCSNYKDPYDLVHAMMETIVERPKVDKMIRATVSTLLPRLVKSPESLVSKRMDSFFGNSNFNISLFMDTLNDEIKIPEVNVFRKMVDDGNINLAYALKGFVRYFYDTPQKLVLAFMERIRYRIPMSNDANIVVDTILLNLRGRQLSGSGTNWGALIGPEKVDNAGSFRRAHHP